MKLRGLYQPARKPAFGKVVYLKVLRGQLVACKWPRKRPRVTHPTTLAQMERFRQANWLAKYAPAPVQMAHRRAVEGTSLLPRDLMVASILGRGLTTWIPPHRRRYPVAAVNDLSDTLDLLGSVTGDVLVRGPERWQSTEPATAGQVLTSGQPGAAPGWQNLPGGPGLWQQVVDVTLTAALALGAYHQVSVPSSAQELEFDIHVPATASGTVLAMKFNASTLSNYGYVVSAVNNNGAALVEVLPQEFQVKLHQFSLPAIVAKTFTHGRVWQADANGNAGFWAEATLGATRMLRVTGQWTREGSVQMSQIGFASTAGQGLPIGTRIIIRICVP